LVLSKSYLVTKGALVPGSVAAGSGLVEANARLALLGVVAGFVAVGPGVLLLKTAGSPWVLRLAAVVFLLGAGAALRLPRSGPPAPRTPDEVAELHGASVVLSASAMAVLRGVVGFLSFLVAFGFRRGHAPSWWFGVVLAASLAGSFLGALLAPRLRRAVVEERILLGSLLGVSAASLVAARVGGRPAIAVLAAVVGMGASAAKLGLDAIVQ